MTCTDEARDAKDGSDTIKPFGSTARKVLEKLERRGIEAERNVSSEVWRR